MSSLRVRYQTLEFDDVDIHVRTLRDNQQYADHDGIAERLGISSANWPLFGIVWASGKVLARLMIDYKIEGKRILEVGCGIALSSLVLNHRQADITATDHHPEVAAFLKENTRINGGRTIPFVRTGWEDENSALGNFDLIIGSDLLYEQNHATLLSQFIDQHAAPQCEVIIVDPGRGNRGRFTRLMTELGYDHHREKPTIEDDPDKPFKGHVLHYLR